MHPSTEGSVAKRLLGLRQGKRTVAEYIIDFRTVAAEAGWPDPALRGIFLQLLNDQMKDQLASRDEPASFEELVSLALRLDNRQRERENEKHPRIQKSPFRVPPPLTSPAPPPFFTPTISRPPLPPPEPMEIGRSRLTPEERERRFRAGECLYCGHRPRTTTELFILTPSQLVKLQKLGTVPEPCR